MFCRNCGKEIPENTKFCNRCGAPQSGDFGQSPKVMNQPTAQPTPRSAPQPTQQAYMPQQTVAQPKRRTGLKAGGIIMLVLGILSVIGAFANGTYEYMQYSFDLSDVISILIQIGFVVGGIVMIAKSKK